MSSVLLPLPLQRERGGAREGISNCTPPRTRGSRPSARRLCSQRLNECRFLVRQRTCRTPRKRAQLDRTKPGPHQAIHLELERFAQPPHLARAPLGKRDLELPAAPA